MKKLMLMVLAVLIALTGCTPQPTNVKTQPVADEALKADNV